MSEWIKGHLELLYPSKYLKAADLRGKDVTIEIAGATWEKLVMAGGKRDTKVAIHMRSTKGKPIEKLWIVGKTVLRQIAAALGGETDVARWAGGRITMYPTTCRGGDGKMQECIRVRVRANAAATEIPEDMTAPPAPRPTFEDEDGDAPREPGSDG